ncbi:MAG: LysR family transcriptional regulator [Azospirillaceae bacterium]|nr:LysR family transcriptional regulator [Azospirillaceae bacterium]
MWMGEIAELNTFLAVAREGSFSRAAAQLGVTPSGVSQSIRRLERRLDVRLFVRTTRSVTLTSAGEALASHIAPAFERLARAEQIASIAGGTMSGCVRINVPTVAMELLIAPILASFRSQHRAVRLEITIEDRLIDMVAGRFDAVIRRGNLLEQDMFARRLSDDDRLILVAAPAYLDRGRPLATAGELLHHERIVVRRPRSGALSPWRLQRGAEHVEIRAAAAITAFDAAAARQCAVSGLGIACLAAQFVSGHLARGELIHLIPEWGWSLPGFHLMYAHAHGLAPVLEALRAAIIKRGQMPESAP